MQADQQQEDDFFAREVERRTGINYPSKLAKKMRDILADPQNSPELVTDAELANKIQEVLASPVPNSERNRRLALLYAVALEDRRYDRLFVRLEEMHNELEAGRRKWRADKAEVIKVYDSGQFLDAADIAYTAVTDQAAFRTYLAKKFP